jgi:hypothetical protein
MNYQSKNKNPNANRTIKQKPKRQLRTSIITNKEVGLSQKLGEAIKKTVQKAQSFYEKGLETYEPFSKYVHMLLHENSPSMITPLTPFKVNTKRVYYQDTLQVNANGHLFIGLQPQMLSQFSYISTGSPVLYMNHSAYDPDAVAAAGLIGGWNTNIIGTTGTNINYTSRPKNRIASMHVSFQLTGVSNLNKQGTVHMAENIDDRQYIGDSTSFSVNEIFSQQFAISRLPKLPKYKSVEIMNMDSDSKLEYHYFPITNVDLRNQYDATAVYSDTDSTIDEFTKTFGLVIRSAAVGTTVRVKYEINIESEVETDYINDFPSEYSRCFVDSEPTLRMISQEVDNVIRIDAKQGHGYKNYVRDVAIANNFLTQDRSIIAPQSNSLLAEATLLSNKK